MAISLTEIRANIYKYFEQVKLSGIPLEISCKGELFTVQYAGKKASFGELEATGYDLIKGDPEELVTYSWPLSSHEVENLQ